MNFPKQNLKHFYLKLKLRQLVYVHQIAKDGNEIPAGEGFKLIEQGDRFHVRQKWADIFSELGDADLRRYFGIEIAEVAKAAA